MTWCWLIKLLSHWRAVFCSAVENSSWPVQTSSWHYEDLPVCPKCADFAACPFVNLTNYCKEMLVKTCLDNPLAIYNIFFTLLYCTYIIGIFAFYNITRRSSRSCSFSSSSSNPCDRVRRGKFCLLINFCHLAVMQALLCSSFVGYYSDIGVDNFMFHSDECHGSVTLWHCMDKRNAYHEARDLFDPSLNIIKRGILQNCFILPPMIFATYHLKYYDCIPWYKHRFH